MLTLPVIIPGKGRIPRLGSIGPKLDPIELPLETIEAIIRAPHTPGVAYLNPQSGETVAMNLSNYRAIFDKHAHDRLNSVVTSTTVVPKPVVKEEPAPVVTESSVAPELIVTESVHEVKEPEPAPVATEEKVVEEVAAEVTEPESIDPEEPAATEETPAEDDRNSTEVQGFKRITKPDNNSRNSHKNRH